MLFWVFLCYMYCLAMMTCIGLYEQQKYIIHVIKTVENNRRKGNGKKIHQQRSSGVQETKRCSKRTNTTARYCGIHYPTYMIPTRKRFAFSELLGTLNDDKSSFSF